MKAVVIGLWVTLVALGSTYAAALYHPKPGQTEAAADPTALQHQKTRVINVPLLANGELQGFIAMQFEVTMDAALLKATPVPPELYLLDDAFRAVYADSTIDFHNIGKYDLGKLTASLATSVNQRLGAPLIKDVLIAEFSYIPKDATHL